MERLEARVAPSQKEAIVRAAGLVGSSLTDFVVSSAYERALATIEAHRRLELDEKASLEFANALLSEAKPGKRLQQAAKNYREKIGK